MTAPTADQLERQIAELSRQLRFQVLPEFREMELMGYGAGGAGGQGRRVSDSDPTGDSAVGFQQGAGDEDPKALSREGEIRRKLERVGEMVNLAAVMSARAVQVLAAARKLTNEDLATRKVTSWPAKDAWEAEQRARERARTGNARAWRHESEEAVKEA